jgi:hypothetical protein
MKIFQIKLRFTVFIFEKGLEGNGNERTGYRLTAAPFPADFIHHGITSILPFPYQILDHHSRYEQQ